MLKKYPFLALSFLFSVKALIMPDVASVVLAIVWIASHFLIHFVGTNTARARLLTRIDAFEAINNGKIDQLSKEVIELKAKVDLQGFAKAQRGSF